MRSAACASSDTSSKSLIGLILSAGRGSDSGATVGLPSARVISASNFFQRRGTGLFEELLGFGWANQLKVENLLSFIAELVFQQQSRKIGMIVPSVVVSEKHTDTLVITGHPVENGAAIADHTYKKPSEVVMEVGFAGGGSLLDFASNLTATNLLGLSLQQTFQELLDLQESRIPFDVVIGKRLYSNMLIHALEVTTDKTTENVLSAVLTLR